TNHVQRGEVLVIEDHVGVVDTTDAREFDLLGRTDDAHLDQATRDSGQEPFEIWWGAVGEFDVQRGFPWGSERGREVRIAADAIKWVLFFGHVRPVKVLTGGPTQGHIQIIQVRAAQLGCGLSYRVRNFVEQLDQARQRNAAEQDVERNLLVVEQQATRRQFDPSRALAEFDARHPARHAQRQLPDAQARIDEVRVVAELAVIQPDGTRDHVLQARQRHEALTPVTGDFTRVHAPQAGIVRDHEVPADALTEVIEAKLFEIRRHESVPGKVRCQEPLHAIVGDLRRKPEGVRLERVTSVDAVRPDHASTLNLQMIGPNPSQHFGAQGVVFQVQQMPGAVEVKAAVFERHGVPSRLRELLENSIANAAPPELDRRTHASEDRKST